MVDGPRQPATYQNWVTRKMRSPSSKLATLEFGRSYLFGYEPDRSERNMTPLDMVPLFIVTRVRNGGLLGINVLSLTSITHRRRIVEEYIRIMSLPKEDDRKDALLRMELAVKANGSTKPALKFYSKNRIKGRIIEVLPEELATLVTRTL